MTTVCIQNTQKPIQEHAGTHKHTSKHTRSYLKFLIKKNISQKYIYNVLKIVSKFHVLN